MDAVIHVLVDANAKNVLVYWITLNQYSLYKCYLNCSVFYCYNKNLYKRYISELHTCTCSYIHVILFTYSYDVIKSIPLLLARCFSHSMN